jgi:hypothetical protein
MLTSGTFGKSADTNIGVQAALSLPQGEFKSRVDSNNGYGAGIFFDIQFEGGHVLRPRFDFTQYATATLKNPGISDQSRQWSDYSLGTDYLYYLSGKPQGFYVTFGLGVTKTNLKYTYNNNSINESYTRFGTAIGLGYSFNQQWEGSLRYTTSSVQNVNPSAVKLGLAFKF